MSNKTALITGASGGIGLGFAQKFAQEGHNVILVARSKDKLESIAADLSGKHGIKAAVIVSDLAKADAPREIFNAVKAQGLQVDILVNNAGFAGYGEFVEQDEQWQMDMIQVNVNALTHLTRLFLPEMIARKSGKVLHVASTAAFMPGPLMAVYYATKAFVLSFGEALAREVEGTGVSVTTLCPGPTASDFQSRADMGDSKLVSGRQLMSIEQVVNEGYDALMSGRAVYVPGLISRLQITLPRILPRGIVRNMVYNAQDRVGH